MARSTGIGSEPGVRTREGRVRGAMTAALLVALAVLALSVGGCSSGGADETRAVQSPPARADFPVEITDDAGRAVTIESEPARIVSLAPANTEILFALGLGDEVVGVTTYCDYPAEAKDKPKIGDFVSPNLEAIAAAQPDLVLATGGVQADVIGKLEGLGAKVLVFDPQSFDGVKTAIERVGQATGTSERAIDITNGLDADIEDLAAAAPEGAEPVAAFIEIGQNPLFTAGPGTLLGDLIRLSDGANVVSEPGYVAYSLEQLVQKDPTVYLATKGSMSDPSDLSKRAGYSGLAAVKNGRVYVLDDNLVTRPGPRIGEGLKSIAKALHPDWQLGE